MPFKNWLFARSKGAAAPVDIWPQSKPVDQYAQELRYGGYAVGKVEPVINVWRPETDWTIRNRYGAEVWVSRTIPILDIDCEDRDRRLEYKIAQTAGRYGDCWRLYRTAAGYRLLLPNISGVIRRDSYIVEPRNFDWGSWEHLPVDETYKRLCLQQRVWRARLTPKPWRVENGTEAVCCPINAGEKGGGPEGSQIPQPYQELVAFHDHCAANRDEELQIPPLA